MNRSLRPWSRSRPSLVLAWLAWLILLVSPLQAAPVMSAAGAAHGGHATAAANHGAHAADSSTQAMADDCCASQQLPAGEVASHACHCASMCASALPAWTLRTLDRVSLQVAPTMPLQASTPRGVHVPLLRPPAA